MDKKTIEDLICMGKTKNNKEGLKGICNVITHYVQNTNLKEYTLYIYKDEKNIGVYRDWE